MSQQQSFYVSVKEIFEKNNSNLLNQKINDAQFQQMSEQILKEQLNKTQKFQRFQQLFQQLQIKDSGNYIENEVLQYLSEILQSKIILIKYNQSLKQFFYQSFQSIKRENQITIYSLTKSLVVCLRNKQQINNLEGLGDGFNSFNDMAKIQQSNQLANYNSNTNSINRTIISAQGNKRESNYQPFIQVENMKLCDKCKQSFDISLLYKNDQCKLAHNFCFQCLRDQNQNKKFCIERNCTSSMNPELVNQFLSGYPKKLLQSKQQQSFQQQQYYQQQSQQQSQQQQLQQQIQQQNGQQKAQVQNQPVYRCAQCNKDINQDSFFYDNCAHIYCQDCIQNKYRDYQSNQQKAKCVECDSFLDINKIKQFINNKLETNQKKCMTCNKTQREDSLFYAQCRHFFCYDCINQQYNIYISNNSSIRCKECYTVIPIENVIKYLNQRQNRQSESPSKQNKDNNQNKDQLSKSINFQDSQPNSQGISLNQQSSPLKQCIKCSKLNTLSNMYVTPCKHGYCLSCTTELQRLLQYQKEVCCFGSTCPYRISITELSKFIINQGQSKQQIPQSQSIQTKDLNKIGQNQYETPKCLKCRNKFRKEELFFVKSCQHSFCLKCLCTKQLEYDQIRCLELGCKSIINVEEIEEFHFQSQMMSSQHLQGKNEQQFEVICSYCKKQDSISSSQKPDYFKCSSCQKVTCLVHQGQVPQCRCYCEKCGNECKISENTVMCPKCNYSYCMNCKQTEVGNKICQCLCRFCGTQLKASKQLCKCIENVCSICLNSFENIQLNNSDDTLLRKNQCIHFFCNICYYKKVASETQNKQFGNLKFQCLFC
ncbi:hypothetical protein ABPG74_019393 [Tetrahymena malaccensis]